MSFIRLSIFMHLLLLLSSLPAIAMDIWPLNPQLVLEPNVGAVRSLNPTTSALFFLDNGTKSNTRYQVRVFGWSQRNNQDIYQDQEDVVPQPPIIEFKNAAKQVVRLENSNQNNSNIERSYRLLIDEIPNPESVNQSGVQFKMQFVIPFFVYPATIDKKYIEGISGVPEKVSPASWRIIQREGKQYVEIKNLGNVHLRLANVYFSRKGANRAIYNFKSGLLGYVLAGQSMQFELKNWRLGSGQGLVLYATYGEGLVKVIGNDG